MEISRRKIGLWIGICIGLIVFALLPANDSNSTLPTTFAQSDGNTAACDTLITDALAEVANTCLNIGRNEVCYGHSQVSATLLDDSYFFEAPGDIVPVGVLDAIVTRSADPDTGEWGVAVMDVEADLPTGTDSVRMVMFGDMEVTPNTTQLVSEQSTCTYSNNFDENVNLRAGAGLSYRVVDVLDIGDSLQVYGQSEDGEWLRSNRGWVFGSLGEAECNGADLSTFVSNEDTYTAPMQAFTLQVNDAAQCEATPPGMLIQVPDGQTANIMVNNVELRIGSTVYVTIVEDDDTEDEDDESLLVANLEGDVFSTSDGTTQHIFEGSQSTTPLDEDGNANGPSQSTEPIGDPVQNLPEELLTNTLENDVTIPDPLTFTPTTSGDGGTNGGGSGDVPLGQWGACGSCNTCVGPADECVVDPNGVCVWDAAGCGNLPTGAGNGASVSCSAFCGGSTTMMIDQMGSFTLTYTSNTGATVSSVSTSSTNPSIVNGGADFISANQYAINFTCGGTGGPEQFKVDVIDSNGQFFQVGVSVTCN